MRSSKDQLIRGIRMAQSQPVEGPADSRLRMAEFAAQDRDREAADKAARRENENFVQVYPKGWARIRKIMKENPAAARVYLFLAEHIDSSTGSVCVAQEVLADELEVAPISIRRHTKWLEDNGAIVRIKVGTGVYAYALDPTDVWRSWDKGKATAAFNTKTLVRKADRANGDVRRKLSVMLREGGRDPEEASDQ